MRVIYSLGDRRSANLQAKDLLQYLPNAKVAAHASTSSDYLPIIDWNLDSIKHDKNNISLLYKDIELYAPQLIIVDAEPILAKIANYLGIKTISISAMHAIDGIELESSQKTKYKNILKKAKSILDTLNVSKKYIYSPFGDLHADPPIKNGYEWLSVTLPYNKVNGNILVVNDNSRVSYLARFIKSAGHNFSIHDVDAMTSNSCVFTTGDSALISNALECNNYLFLAPSLSDPEAVYNSMLCAEYGLGIDLGSVEVLGRYALNMFKMPNKIEDIKFKKKNKTIQNIIGEQDACSV